MNSFSNDNERKLAPIPGSVLIYGPPGSGKSTALYTLTDLGVNTVDLDDFGYHPEGDDTWVIPTIKVLEAYEQYDVTGGIAQNAEQWIFFAQHLILLIPTFDFLVRNYQKRADTGDVWVQKNTAPVLAKETLDGFRYLKRRTNFEHSGTVYVVDDSIDAVKKAMSILDLDVPNDIKIRLTSDGRGSPIGPNHNKEIIEEKERTLKEAVLLQSPTI
jgi:adenylate kinase family enzyme